MKFRSSISSGIPASGPKTDMLCWKLLYSIYSRMRSLIIMFSRDTSGLSSPYWLSELNISALILALIYCNTPFSSRVSFSTSFNSLMVAIFWVWFQIYNNYLMLFISYFCSLGDLLFGLEFALLILLGLHGGSLLSILILLFRLLLYFRLLRTLWFICMICIIYPQPVSSLRHCSHQHF